MNGHGSRANEIRKAFPQLRGVDAVEELLVDDDEVQIAQRFPKSLQKGCACSGGKRVRVSEIDPALFRPAFHRLDVHGGIPVRLLDQDTADIDGRGVQDPRHLPSEGIAPQDAERADAANAQGGEVAHDVSRASQGVALAADGPGGEPRFDRDLRKRWVQGPIGVQAEVADDADAGAGDAREKRFRAGPWSLRGAV